MSKNNPPAQTGDVQKQYTGNIPDIDLPVKTSNSDNLIFFHNVLAELPAEEYKIAMSAICQYCTDGTIPALTGLIKAVVLLAIDRIAAQQSAPRKRGGQIGNQNAAKKHSSNETEIEKTNKNEAETNKNETKQGTQVPISAPQPANVAPAPANLNLNINNLNNINLIKFLESENESENEKRNRIKNSLKQYGFCLTDKTVNKIISSVPDTMWLIDGYDFPSYLAKSVSEKYRNKGKTALDLQKIFLSALDRKDTWEAWDHTPTGYRQKWNRFWLTKKPYCAKRPRRTIAPIAGKP